jgi:hypothetical protein
MSLDVDNLQKPKSILAIISFFLERWKCKDKNIQRGVIMYICNTVLYKHTTSLWIYGHNFSNNRHVQIKIYQEVFLALKEVIL